jgi:hypothetical protein
VHNPLANWQVLFAPESPLRDLVPPLHPAEFTRTLFDHPPSVDTRLVAAAIRCLVLNGCPLPFIWLLESLPVSSIAVWRSSSVPQLPIYL